MRRTLREKADVNNLPECVQFLEVLFNRIDADTRFRDQFTLAFEELFINICRYAYESGGTINLFGEANGDEVIVKISDSGTPFNPIEYGTKEDASVEERLEGGLGIFLAKKNVDELDYQYKNGQNQLTLTKRLAF